MGTRRVKKHHGDLLDYAKREYFAAIDKPWPLSNFVNGFKALSDKLNERPTVIAARGAITLLT